MARTRDEGDTEYARNDQNQVRYVPIWNERQWPGLQPEADWHPDQWTSDSTPAQQKMPRTAHTQEQLIGGIAHKAEAYPPGFCQAVMKGILDQMKQDGGWFLSKDGESQLHEVYVADDENEIEDEDEVPDLNPGGMEAIGEKEEETTHIGTEEKRALDKLHRGLEHPPLNEPIRFMKSARIKGEVIR